MPILPNSFEERDRLFLIHPYSNLATHGETGPLVIVRGEGIHVFDESGKEYIEGLGGLWSVSLGFSERELAEAAMHQMQTLPYYHGFHSKSTPPMIDLAERLVQMSPVADAKVFFANSGSEINDTVLKLIWYVNNVTGRPERKKIISRHRSYHGVTMATASLTGTPINHADFDLPIGRFVKAMCPDYYREGLPGETESEFTDRCVADLEALIEREGAETIAAFFADPVIAGGGVVPPPVGYFAGIQRVLRKHGILFVADEVICGFGRTGNMFACDTYDLAPDVMTVAKALSSSYVPISAALLGPAIWEALVTGSRKHGVLAHGFTYSGHPVAAAVALKTLEIMERRDIVGHVRDVSTRFQERLKTYAGHPLVGDVRTVGLLGGIELVADKGTKAFFDKELAVGAYCARRCQEHGLIIRPIGDIMAFCPPLIIENGEIDEMFDRFDMALSDTHAMVAQRGAMAG